MRTWHGWLTFGAASPFNGIRHAGNESGYFK